MSYPDARHSPDLRTQLRGVLPAMVTPFRPDFALDEAAIGELIRSLLKVEGIMGLVVNGVAGEVSALTTDEQALVVRVVVQAANDRVPVIAGISAETPRGAARAAERAAHAGARGVLVQAPALFGRGIAQAPEVAVSYFREVAAVGSPLIVFQHQVGTGRAYPIPLLLRLLDIDNVVAVKETVWDAERYEAEVRAIRRHRPDTRILCGNDTILLSCLALGGYDGLLVGFATLVPELIVDLYEAVERGDLKAAQAVNDRLAALTEAIYAPPPINYYARMKAALVLLGRVPHAAVRPPVQPTPKAEIERLRAALCKARLL